jgi:hypothetical protein
MSVSPRRSVSGLPQPTHALHGGAGDEAYADPEEDDDLGSVENDFIEAGDDEPDRGVSLEGPGR